MASAVALRGRRHRHIVEASCAVFSLLCVLSHGTTIYVQSGVGGSDTSNCGLDELSACATIKYAVDSRTSSYDTVSLLPGTHFVSVATGILVQSKSLTFEGHRMATIDCAHNNRAFRFQQGHFVVSGITISNCSTFNSRRRGGHGGGISIWGSFSGPADELTIRNSVIRNCKSQASSFGGGLIAVYAKVTITNSSFENNWAKYGAGIYVQGTAAHGLEMQNSLFQNNTAINFGGGYAGTGHPGTIDNCTFLANRVGNASVVRGTGGGLFYTGGSLLGVHNSQFINNSATGTGGGIYMKETTNCLFDALNLTGNTAELAGGGVALGQTASPVVTNVLVEKNIASYGGGMAFSDIDSSPIIEQSVIRNNIVIGTWDKAPAPLAPP